ncbi:hypothetical protein SDC9_164157 [bioreactor metagenome]|uniref:Uncharacterized protein n=1 Tax=bioreactor metagenome TaxID=1076179 RepID=A0A645FSE0_9ZZZZ
MRKTAVGILTALQKIPDRHGDVEASEPLGALEEPRMFVDVSVVGFELAVRLELVRLDPVQQFVPFREMPGQRPRIRLFVIRVHGIAVPDVTAVRPLVTDLELHRFFHGLAASRNAFIHRTFLFPHFSSLIDWISGRQFRIL